MKGWRYFELSLAQDLLPRELMVAVDERVPPSLFVFNLITTAQSAYITVKEPTREAIAGCASGNTIAAIFTLILYLECEYATARTTTACFPPSVTDMLRLAVAAWKHPCGSRDTWPVSTCARAREKVGCSLPLLCGWCSARTTRTGSKTFLAMRR